VESLALEIRPKGGLFSRRPALGEHGGQNEQGYAEGQISVSVNRPPVEDNVLTPFFWEYDP
jgi:hypothetical protein